VLEGTLGPVPAALRIAAIEARAMTTRLLHGAAAKAGGTDRVSTSAISVRRVTRTEPARRRHARVPAVCRWHHSSAGSYKLTGVDPCFSGGSPAMVSG
jgi:hypothetical protein